MSSHRPILIAMAMVALVWSLALGGYYVAKNARVTADKLLAYLHSVDLGRLSGEARARALREAASKLNALSPEERRKARMTREWQRWFAAMTDEEKGTFLEATMPSGFKQALTAFEELPAEKRRRAIDDALRRLRDAKEADDAGKPGSAAPAGETNGAPILSEELRKKMTTIGLKTFYSESSAQSKAELAPVLEEVQRMMETGALFRDRH